MSETTLFFSNDFYYRFQTDEKMLKLIYLKYLMSVTISLGSVLFTGINCYKSVILKLFTCGNTHKCN